MGVDCATFHALLCAGFAHQWNQTAIPCPNTNSHGLPHLGRRSLSAEGALALALHYVTSTMNDTSLQQIFALTTATISHYCAFTISVLLSVLNRMLKTSITWWADEDKCDADSNLIAACHPLLLGAIGSIDSVNLLIIT